MKPIRLTADTRFSGCGAKLGPGLLDQALCGLDQPAYPDLIVGFSTSDDAGVYRIDEQTAVVQTIDFFPPIVDDPFTFGRIAAANALSDIYAMGGRPITALAVVCFPMEKMAIEVLRAMMKGGLDALVEAGCALVGGHSIVDETVKFGFAVTGLVHPDQALRNNTPRPGEAVILTKPLGTGLVNAAFRAGMASPRALDAAIASMTRLNASAARIAAAAGASACTDVTGFGLLGHAAEMVAGAPVGFRIDFTRTPLLPDVAEYAATGLVPGGTYRNRDFRRKVVVNHDALMSVTSDILFDPQTSGGLLFTVAPEKTAAVLAALAADGATAAVIGETTERAGLIEVTA